MAEFVRYEGGDWPKDPVFNRTCPRCGKFVKTDPECHIQLIRLSSARARAFGRCKEHGRVQLTFIAWE